MRVKTWSEVHEKDNLFKTPYIESLEENEGEYILDQKELNDEIEVRIRSLEEGDGEQTAHETEYTYALISAQEMINKEPGTVMYEREGYEIVETEFLEESSSGSDEPEYTEDVKAFRVSFQGHATSEEVCGR